MSAVFDSADWLDLAQCRGRDREFFPGKTEGNSSLRVRQAKRICVKCPVQTECLQRCYTLAPKWGLLITRDGEYLVGVTGWREEAEEGIWGGTTPEERRAVSALPIPERIELLRANLLAQTRGRNAIATPEEVIAS